MIPVVFEKHVKASATTETLITNPVPAGFLFVCKGIYAVDDNNIVTGGIKLAISSSTAIIPIDRVIGSIAAGDPVVYSDEVVIGPEQSIAAVFGSPTSGDKLHLYAHGYLLPVWS